MNQSLSLIVSKYKKSLNIVIDNFEKYLLTLKIGKVSPHLLDNINVKHNNQKSKIKYLANISIKKPNIINIKPWDKNNIKIIEKAILESQSNLIPNSDGSQISIKVSEPTKQDRIEILKEVKKRGENGKISIRKHRRDFNNLVKICVKENNHSSNLEKINLTTIQNMTNDAVKKIDSITDLKKNDIMNT